jgi:hypothetical protein
MFKRSKDDEDPFAALKGGGTYHSEPAAVPSTPTAWPTAGAASATPGSTPTPMPRSTAPRPRRTRRTGMGIFGWMAIPITIAVLAGVAVLLLATVGSSSNSGVAPVKSVSVAHHSVAHQQPQPNTTGGGAPTPHRTQTADYLTAAGLKSGLAELAKLSPGARILDLKVTSAQLTGIMQRPNHSVELVSVSPGARFTAGAGPTGEHPLPISAIHPAVVAKLVTEMHHHFGVPPSRIDYMVAFWFPQAIAEWEVFVKGDSMHPYLATLAGAQLHQT